MNLFSEFVRRLLNSGFAKRDIRFFLDGDVFRNKIFDKNVGGLSKEFGINRGSIYQMCSGKRAVPLDILEKFQIDPSEYKMIISGSNIPIKIPIKLTNNLAYLVGLLRDGTVCIEQNNEYLCAYYSKNKEFLEGLRDPRCYRRLESNERQYRLS